MVFSPLVLVALAALPLVDPGARELRSCRRGSISFRTAAEGWVMSRCGVFHTTDGGLSWEHDRAIEQVVAPDEDPSTSIAQLEFMRWFNLEVAVAGGTGWVVRTEDGGKTWSKVWLPSRQSTYSTFVRGSTVWVCGSAGELNRSDDSGRTWVKMASPFDAEDRCLSVAFGAAGVGEATGMNGSRWKTTDDGKTWANVAPAQPQYRGPRLLATGSQDEGTTRVEGLTASLDDEDRLVLESGDRSPRVLPLRSKGTGLQVPLLGVEAREGGLAGWTADALFLTDDGEDWYWVGALPAAVRRLTFLSRRAVVLETAQGVYRSESAGREWKKSRQPAFDRGDAAVARGGSGLPNPLACVATSKSAALNAVVQIHGCAGVWTDALALEVRMGAPRLNGKPVVAAKLDEFVRTLGERSLRREEPMGCRSSAWHEVTVSWSCDGSAWQSLNFESDGCGSEEGVAGRTSPWPSAGAGYARALGIAALVRPLAFHEH